MMKYGPGDYHNNQDRERNNGIRPVWGYCCRWCWCIVVVGIQNGQIWIV